MIEFQIIPLMSYPANPQAEYMFNFFFSVVMYFGAIAFVVGLFVRWLNRT